MRSSFLITAAAISVAGCATTKTNYRPVPKQISFPPLNQTASASVGDDMVRQGTYVETKGISLAEPNNIRGYKFSAGFYPQIGEDDKYTYHSYQIGNGLNGMGALQLGGGIFSVGNDGVSLRATKGSNELCVDRVYGAKACDTEHGYERSTRPMVSENNFQQSLIYNGRVGDRVKIGYREFSGSVARPAFSNEVEYDLSVSADVNYKGAKIHIISADNQKINYIVLSNFNTSRQRV